MFLIPQNHVTMLFSCLLMVFGATGPTHKEKDAAFDLLDAITKSGALPLSDPAQLSTGQVAAGGVPFCSRCGES